MVKESKLLPTIKSNELTCCDFLDAVHHNFTGPGKYCNVRMYFYGVTVSGWELIRHEVTTWKSKKAYRKVQAFIGTDHALTEPEALRRMTDAGIDVFLLIEYRGVYHPKLIVYESRDNLTIVSGSNNLTGAGFKENIEFATQAKLLSRDRRFAEWEAQVKASSRPISPALLNQYEKDRNRRINKLNNAELRWEFTWKNREQTRLKPDLADLPDTFSGSETLMYEVMPRETGTNGTQIQILKSVATGFFGLPSIVGSSIGIELTNQLSNECRCLVMSFNANTTMRLSIHEASFIARPCFLLFKKTAPCKFLFRVISLSDYPGLYKSIDKFLGTREKGKRRYKIT